MTRIDCLSGHYSRQEDDINKYLWQLDSWPHMRWDSNELMLPLGKTRFAQGQLHARSEQLGIELYAKQMEEEVYSTTAIEGAKLDRTQIRSSVERRLGIRTAGTINPDRNVDGLVQVLLDAAQNYSQILSSQRLKGWQAALFPTGYSEFNKIVTGDWRKTTSSIQVVSGTPEKETVLPHRRLFANSC